MESSLEQPLAGRWTGQVANMVRTAPSLAALIVMAVIGIGISIYLTTVHYANAPLLCGARGGFVDCGDVLRSSYSLVPGTQIPITIPGMLWFVVSAGLAVLAWQTREREDDLPWRIWLAQILWGAVGVVTILYLVYAELVQLHHLCAWCTGVHVLTVLSFFAVLLRNVSSQPVDDVEDAGESDA
jgi:uncharacterized membrane protein